MKPGMVGINKALIEGCKLHAFLSGGGLRVIRLEDELKILKGYGEHPHVDEALGIAGEDYLNGHGAYKSEWLTGSTSTEGDLDAWVRQGQTFDAYLDKETANFRADVIVVVLKGYGRTVVPKEIEEFVLETGTQTAWQNRVYTYLVTKIRFANGAQGVSWKEIRKPEGRENSDSFMYEVTKTGKGFGFEEALKNALAAPEVEDL
jgi:hypothetical protein